MFELFPFFFNNDKKYLQSKEIVDNYNQDYDILTEELFGAPFNPSIIKSNRKEITEGVYYCSNERLNSYFKDLKLKQNNSSLFLSSSLDLI